MEKNAEVAKLKNFSRSLGDVALTDYFATQKVIRELVDPEFNQKEYDREIVDAFKWVRDQKDPLSKLSSKDLPDFVQKNRLTIGLYLEILKEIADKKDPIYKMSVAFPLTSPELREDIEKVLKGRKEATGDDDVKSFVIFTRYWNVLRSRAKILKGTI